MTILLVQEKLPALNTLKEYVAACYPDSHIIAYTDAADALCLIESGEEPIDLCFTEIIMKGVSGFRIVEELRQRNRYAKAVFLAEDDHTAVEAWKNGLNDYLIKPVTMDGIRHTLRSCAALLNSAPDKGDNQ